MLSLAASQGLKLENAHQRMRCVQPLASNCRCLQMWACATGHRVRIWIEAFMRRNEQVCQEMPWDWPRSSALVHQTG